METGIVNIKGRSYKTVALRVSEFREKHPVEEGWAILTEIVARDENEVVVKASILNPDSKVVGVGFAEEKRRASQINQTSALENAETSAIGRALANIGLAGSEYASANEVVNAIHQQSGGAVAPVTKNGGPAKVSPEQTETYKRDLDLLKAAKTPNELEAATSAIKTDEEAGLLTATALKMLRNVYKERVAGIAAMQELNERFEQSGV